MARTLGSTNMYLARRNAVEVDVKVELILGFGGGWTLADGCRMLYLAISQVGQLRLAYLHLGQRVTPRLLKV